MNTALDNRGNAHFIGLTNVGILLNRGTVSTEVDARLELSDNPGHQLSNSEGGGNLTGPGVVEFHGTVTLFGAAGSQIEVDNVADYANTVDGAPDLKIKKNYWWRTSEWKGAGKMLVAQSAQLVIMDEPDPGPNPQEALLLGRTLINDGFVSWEGKRDILVRNAANITNNPTVTVGGVIVGGLFEIKVPQILRAFGFAGTFTNKGLVEKTGAGTAEIWINNDLQGKEDGQQGKLKFKEAATIPAGNGKVTVASAAEIDFDGGLMQAGGDIQVAAGGILGVTGTLAMSGGVFALLGELDVAGNFAMSGGTFMSTAQAEHGTTIAVTAGGNFTLSGGTAGLTFTDLTVAGTISLTGGYFNLSGSNAVTASTVSIASGGNFRLIGTNTVTAPTVSIASNGTLSGVGGLNFLTNTFSNSGLIDLGESYGPYLVGWLSVSPTAGASSAAFTQGSGGRLEIGLAGTSNYSSLSVSGTATVNGTVNVAGVNGFTPSMGTQFWIINAGILTAPADFILPAGYWTEEIVGPDGNKHYQIRRVM